MRLLYVFVVLERSSVLALNDMAVQDINNYKASHLSDILSDIESNISHQNRRRAINFTSPNSMNVPLSKEHGFFTIWAIPATHDELCLSKVQNSFSKEALTP